MLSVRVCADAPVGSAAKNATATAAHNVVPRTFLMRILPSVMAPKRCTSVAELSRCREENCEGGPHETGPTLGVRPPTGWNLVRAPREWSRSAAIRCGIDCGRDSYRRSARRPATIDIRRYGRRAVLPRLS